MVHFHLHTNGSADETGDDGHVILVSKFLVRAVWVGLAVLLWFSAVLVIVEIIRGFRHL